MVKPGSIRQNEYEQRQKEIDKEGYLKKRREQKKKAMSCNKSKQTKVWSIRSKRQNEKKGSSYPILKFTVKFILYNTTGFGKGCSRTSKSLPRSPFKKRQVIPQLVSSLSPNSKGQIFAFSQRRIGTCLGWPSISTEKRDTVKSLLQWPDISYCKPGRRGTIYYRKIQQGEKEYKLKHYLL